MNIPSTIPRHHMRYAVAWMLHQDEHLSKDVKRILEDEMDHVQNSFTFEEFQTFKQTLPGFVEFWEAWKRQVFELNQRTLV